MSQESKNNYEAKLLPPFDINTPYQKEDIEAVRAYAKQVEKEDFNKDIFFMFLVVLGFASTLFSPSFIPSTYHPGIVSFVSLVVAMGSAMMPFTKSEQYKALKKAYSSNFSYLNDVDDGSYLEQLKELANSAEQSSSIANYLKSIDDRKLIFLELKSLLSYAEKEKVSDRLGKFGLKLETA